MNIGKPPDHLPPAPTYARLTDDEARKLARAQARDDTDFERALRTIEELRSRSRWLSDDLDRFFPPKGANDGD